MKAISLWQPWASFMAEELKVNETRNRLTHFRGELAICSAQRKVRYMEFGAEIEDLIQRMGIIQWQRTKLWSKRPPLLPLGCVVCVVNVYDCQPVEQVKVRALERLVGDYSPGRFAWLTRNCRALKTPVPMRGKQGFFNLPSDVEAQVRAQL